MCEGGVAGHCVEGFRPGEECVCDAKELWYRNCFGDYWDAEKHQPGTLMYKWGDYDNGELSGARSSKSTAEQAYQHAVDIEDKVSHGVWGVSVGSLSGMELHLHDDSANLPEPPASPPGHTYLDVNAVPAGRGNPAKREREKVRSRLLRAATVQYLPEDD